MDGEGEGRSGFAGRKTLTVSRRSVLTGGAALAGVLPLVLSGNAAFAQDGKVLRIAHRVFDQKWSPLTGGGVIYNVAALSWASAMYFDKDSNLHPYVVNDYSSNDDHTVWTFSIDPAAVFSDGSPITAADFKGSLELAARPATGHQRIDQVIGGVNGFAAVKAGEAVDLAGIVATDERSFVVTLGAPDPAFHLRMSSLLAPVVKIAQARNAEGDEAAEWWHPRNGVATSGPFVPVEMDLDAGRVVLGPNPHFFGPAPLLERIEITTVEDMVTQTTLLQAREFDMSSDLLTPTAVQDLGAGFMGGPEIPKGQHFWFNVNVEPTNDPKVREALILAVDRDGLLAASYPDGPHFRADQVLNAVSGKDDAPVAYPFDPEAARAALAASSYGGPDNLPLLMMVGISNPANESAAQYIAEQWRQNLGITAVEMKPQVDSYAGPDQGRIQIFRNDVGTRVPDAVIYLLGAIHSASSNAQKQLGGYANAEIDALLDAAKVLPLDDPDRDAKAREAQRIFMSEHPFLPWHHSVQPRFAMPWVQGADKNLDWQVYQSWLLTVDPA